MSRTSQCAVVLLLIGAVGCSVMQPATGPVPYPATRTVDVVDDYHGTRVADPYRWLEDLDSPEVRNWAVAQTDLAMTMLRGNETRRWIVDRVGALRTFWEEPSADPESTKVLVDEASLGEGKSLVGSWPSPDGAWVAYAVSDRGSEWVETRIRRLSDGTDFDERIDGMLWSDAQWTHDGRGFFYVHSRKPAAGERTAIKGPAVHYHLVGTPQSADRALLRTPEDATDLVLEQELSEDGRYLFIYEGNGAYVDEIGWLLTRMYLVDLGDPLRPTLSARVVPLTRERDAAYRVVASEGETLYVLTDRDAPRRRIVAVDIRNPAPAHWRDVVPEGDAVIDRVWDIDGRFVVLGLRDLQHAVRVHDRSGGLVRELAIPPMTAVLDVRSGASDDELVVDANTAMAPTRTRHDLAAGTVAVERAPKWPFPADDFETKLVWYASKYGVRVPMFVLHRRGLVLDRSHPTLLLGYGASSQMTLPPYGEWVVAALELGMVLALPALRGGGELGRSWYDAATLDRKQATFDDFIAAAEYLIAEGYTSPERLGIHGASNGGLLVAAVVNQRPDLFRVAVAEVPQTDALRYDRGRHITQFGDAMNPAHFPFLLAYSPQHNVERACHPATLVTTALNDDRAPAWMAMKYAAALQAAQSCPRPIILRVATGGGHIGNETEDAADAVAFIATQLGVTPPRSQAPSTILRRARR